LILKQQFFYYTMMLPLKRATFALITSQLIFCTVFSPGLIEGQVPRECANEGLLTQRISCCPTPDGFDKPCGGPGRGKCVKLENPERNRETDLFTPKLDTVFSMWPNSIYKEICVCSGHFTGSKCDECVAGYKGPNCEHRMHSKVRKWINHVNSEEADLLLKAFRLAQHLSSDHLTLLPIANGAIELKQLTVFEHHAWIHYMASAEQCFGMGYGTGSAFPTWNRAFLLQLESTLGRLVQNHSLTLPYWFWFIPEPDNAVVGNSTIFSALDTLADQMSICQTWATRLQPLCDICSGRAGTLKYYNLNDYNQTLLQIQRLLDHVDDEDLKKQLNFILHRTLYVQNGGLLGFTDELDALVSHVSPVSMDGLHNVSNNEKAIAVLRYLLRLPTDLNAENPLYYLALSAIDWLFDRWQKINHVALNQISLTNLRGKNKFDLIVPLFPTNTHGDYFGATASYGYKFEKIIPRTHLSLPFFLIIQVICLTTIVVVVLFLCRLFTPLKSKMHAQEAEDPLIDNGLTSTTVEIENPASNGKHTTVEETWTPGENTTAEQHAQVTSSLSQNINSGSIVSIDASPRSASSD
ncbi:L-dopachrome tautomerase, partial [Trichinella zimbabwensis]